MNQQQQRRVSILPPRFYSARWNEREGEITYSPCPAPAKGESWLKVARADVVRYGRNLVTSGNGEGSVETDTSRMEPPPVVLYKDQESYQRFRDALTYDDDLGVGMTRQEFHDLQEQEHDDNDTDRAAHDEAMHY